MNIDIREVRKKDYKELILLLDSLGYEGSSEYIENRVEQLLKSENDILLVATLEEKVVGFISLHFIPQIALEGDFCRISYFCINKDLRSNGIGNLLESHAVKLAKQRKCDRIEVHCHSRRENAHKFYFRQGYEESPKYLIKTL